MSKLFFSDFFEVDPDLLEEYGAFNISLLTDVPLFLDPFLLFDSEKTEYRELHTAIISYLEFLRDKALADELTPGLLKQLCYFKEVKQNWLGYSENANDGRGLGAKFAKALSRNLSTVFSSFGKEGVSTGSHLEKLTLIDTGVGRDTISDFTTNLIKAYLCKYTETFAKKYIDPSFIKATRVQRAEFNYATQSWAEKSFNLPNFRGDYVLLTPHEILTKDKTWINRYDLVDKFHRIPEAIPNDELRAKVNNYFRSMLTPKAGDELKRKAARLTLQKFPEVFDYYIKYKEEHGDKALANSRRKVTQSQELYYGSVRVLIELLEENTDFYATGMTTFEEARQRALFLKQVIENQDGYRVFYQKNGQPVEREEDLQVMYKLTWLNSPSDINAEVNNGRGPVDFKASRGSKDKSLVEFKLAANTHLRDILEQVKVYKDANQTEQALKVIIYFNDGEEKRVKTMLQTLGISDSRDVVLIDARNNKKPASKVKADAAT